MFKNVTYDRFKQSVTANTQIKDDSTIMPLLNDSVQYAYDSCKYWPRYLNVTPRTLKRGYVDFEEDSFFSYGAGTDGVNGLFVRNGDADGVGKYSIYEDDVVVYDLERSTTWQILDADDVLLYSNTDTGATPPLTGWVTEAGGVAEAPVLVDLPDIGEAIQAWTCEPTTGQPAAPCLFYTDAQGIRVPGVSGDQIWLAYKADLDVNFGDGTGGTSTEIPAEFSGYATYDVSYQLQFNNRQSNPNAYTMAYRKVTDRLDVALLKYSDETGRRFIEDRFRSYFGSDLSIRP